MYSYDSKSEAKREVDVHICVTDKANSNAWLLQDAITIFVPTGINTIFLSQAKHNHGTQTGYQIVPAYNQSQI